MSTRSTLFVLLAFACVAAIIVEDASAWRRRCGRRFSSCGVSRSASWGGSYGSVGSCGTPVSRCPATVCSQVPTQPCSISFGSNGGSGGSYTSVGSVGSAVIISDVLLSTTLDDSATHGTPTPTQGATAPSLDGPIDIIVPEHLAPSGGTLESDPKPHRHLDNATPSKSNSGNGAAPRNNTTSNPANDSKTAASHITQDADQHAFLVLRDVPRDADVYLLGVKMTARGELRRYRIPLLASDVQYDYEVELRLPAENDSSAEVVTQVSAGETTELWVTRAGDRLVLQDQQHAKSESTPLAVK